jgi:hypothetical protein
VTVSGNVVANGGAGAGGCLLPKAGEDGRLDAIPATGGLACDASTGGGGGNGAAGNTGARGGTSINVAAAGGTLAFGGHAGGGVGRTRVNTVSAGLTVTGLFSPNPTTGTIATR